MSTFTRRAALVAAVVGGAPAWADVPLRPGVRGVGPEQFGRVFQRARRSIVRIRTAGPPLRFDIGTYIGAHGELVFGSKGPPPAVIAVTTPGGEAREADVLAHSASAGLAVARVRGEQAEPFDASTPPELALEQWVVAVRLNAKGEPEPFAGTVDGTPRPWSRDRAFELVDVGTPAEPGSPILTTDGRLIAIAIDRGARRTRAIMLVSMLPFLKQAVLGG